VRDGADRKHWMLNGFRHCLTKVNVLLNTLIVERSAQFHSGNSPFSAAPGAAFLHKQIFQDRAGCNARKQGDNCWPAPLCNYTCLLKIDGIFGLYNHSAMHQKINRCHFVPPYLSDEQARDDTFRARRAMKAELEARPFAAYIGTGEAKRFIYDSNNTTFQRLKIARKEGGLKLEDEVVNTAYEYAGVIRNFFKRQLNFHSFDNKGSDLIFNVHYGQDYNNAFWDGDEMTFGDGDGKMFTSFVNSLDVMGHELGHGVIQFTANLDYEKEPGALNEHFADVFGSAIKQSALKETAAQANWLIGDTIVGPSFPGKAIRSMSAPGTAFDGDPQPAHMDQFYKGSDDYYGVHINSGIPNKIFCTVAQKITTAKAVIVWFAALKQLKFDADFKMFKAAIQAAAKTSERSGDIPKGSLQHFTDAFALVGL